MQPHGCILVPAAQIPKQNATTMVFAANPALKSRSLLQVKRPCPKVDDPVMASQNLCTKQARDRLRTSEEIAINQAFEVDHADVFANNRSEEHTSELQSRPHLVCRLLLEKKQHE